MFFFEWKSETEGEKLFDILASEVRKMDWVQYTPPTKKGKDTWIQKNALSLLADAAMSPPTRWDTSLILRHLETSTCFKYKSCRSYARSQDVVLDQDRIDMLVDAINRDLLPRISGSNHGKDSNSEIKENGVECFRRDKVYS